MNIGAWFHAPAPVLSRTRQDPERESAVRMEYVDALLALMVRKSLFTLRLTASQPLPRIENGDKLSIPSPDFQAVINRLKVLSRLDPVMYPEPVRGKIEVPRGPHLLVYTTRFEDRAVPPFCEIHLGIRNA